MNIKSLGRCLVTGASGFVGRALCERLQNEHIYVKALLRNASSGPWQESVAIDLKNIKCIFQDDPTRIENMLENIETVFHLAGIAHTGRTHGISTEDYWRINVEATKIIFMLAAKARVRRFVYFSSIKALDSEDDYARSKRAAEKIVLALSKQYGIHVCILQPTLIYGPEVKGNLKNMIQGIQKGWFPPISETHNQRTLVSVQDIVDAAITVAIDERANGKTYVITDGKTYSTRQIYDAMRKALSLSSSTWSIPLVCLRSIAKMGDLLQILIRKPLPFNSEVLQKLLDSTVYSSELVQQELGWKPKINLYDALPEMVKAIKRSL